MNILPFETICGKTVKNIQFQSKKYGNYSGNIVLTTADNCRFEIGCNIDFNGDAKIIDITILGNPKAIIGKEIITARMFEYKDRDDTNNGKIKDKDGVIYYKETHCEFIISGNRKLSIILISSSSISSNSLNINMFSR